MGLPEGQKSFKIGLAVLFCFSKKFNVTNIHSLSINGNNINRVTTFKLLLGVFISSDLSWDYHVMYLYLLRKVAKRMYCINYLVRAGVPTCDVVCVYTSIIRSVLEYACPVWHPGLTKTLSKDTERVQRRCLKLLFPAFSYAESLSKTGLEHLDNRCDMITQSMFREIKNTKHPLHYLLPQSVKLSHCQMVLRPIYPYQLPLFKTTCCGKDFVPYCISKKF